MLINRSDCLAHFPFEGNVTNAAGGTNGTVTGTTAYADSVSGRGFDFDGSSRVEFGNTTLSNTSDLTILMKINLDTYTNGDRLFCKTTSSPTSGFFCLVNNAAADQIAFRVRNAADSGFTDVIGVNLADTNPYALRCQIDMSTNDVIKIDAYALDGTYSSDSVAYTDASYTSNTDALTIGDFTGGGNGCDGVIDDVVVIEGLITDEDFYRYYMGFGIADL